MPPLPKTCPKTVCPRKGVAFLWKAFLQKNFQVREGFRFAASIPGFGRECEQADVASAQLAINIIIY